MKHMRIQHIILASLLAVMMTFAACKASPVVRVVMPTAQKIDQQMQPDHTQKTSSQTSSSSQTSNANTSAVSSNNSTSSGTVSTSSTTPTDSAAGQATPSATTSNGADLPGGTYGNSGGSNGVAGQGTGTGGTGSASSVASASSSSSSSSTQSVPDRLAAPTAVQVDGQTKQLPTNATKVAAAGQYADMVCMLGGADALLDTSPENKSGLFQEVFNPAETTAPDMPTVGNAISQSNFDNLLNNVKPQMVFYTDGTFTQDQLAQLTAAQIWPVELMVPETLSTPWGITSNTQASAKTVLDSVTYNVDVIATTLSTDAGVNGQHPKDIASAFSSYYNNTVLAETMQKYPVKIQYNFYPYETFYAQNFSINTIDPINGFPVFQPLAFGDYYQIVQNTLSTLKMQTSESAVAYRYRAGLRWGTENDFFSGSLALISYNNLYTNGAATEFLTNSTTSGIVTCGGNPLSNIIVPSKSMPVDGATDPQENTIKIPATKFTIDSSGNAGYIYSGQLVQLNVQPTGLHSWTSGGPESILEPLWLRSVFWSSDYSAAQFQSDLAGFYVKFYHCSQSTASTLAASILSVDQ